MLSDIKQFIARRNVMDLAVGAVFTSIVNSLVDDLINPLVGLFTGGAGFSNLSVALSASVSAAEVALFKFGGFITSIIDFLIVAGIAFLLVKRMTRLRAAVDTAHKTRAAPGGPIREEMLIEIRGLFEARPATSAS